jgi:hypothetical protein
MDDDWVQVDVGPDGAAGEAPYPLCGAALDPNEPLGIISQQLIAEYLGLEELHRRFERLKEWLKRSLEAGAVTEPGPFRLALELRQQRVLTPAAMANALGLSDAELQRLKASAPVRTLRCLVIRPGAGGH